MSRVTIWIIVVSMVVLITVAIIFFRKRITNAFMGTDFKKIWEMTGRHEGGYQAYPEDKANYNSLGQLVGTNRGISAKAWETHFRKPPTAADMKAITPELALEIAKKSYWGRQSGDILKSQPVAHSIFKEYWGSGVAGGGARVQDVLKKEFGVDLKATDGISEAEAKQINSVDQNKLYKALRDRAINARFTIGTGSNKKFLRGWLNGWKEMDSLYNDPISFKSLWDSVDKRLQSVGLEKTRTIAKKS